MTRKRGAHRQDAPAAVAERPEPGAVAAPARLASGRRALIVAAVIALAGLVAIGWLLPGEQRGRGSPEHTAVAAPVTGLPTASYVGGAVCASCHPEQHAAASGSHHDRAMAEASESTVLGNFANAQFTHRGVTSTFFRRDGRYFVRTDGPDGRLADFEIRYTFGFTPLQQYLVPFPDGRLQALGIAWDSRPKGEGGQRWFHLYGERKLRPGDPLHWTGIDQVWNYQCADCHSTNLRKNYDPSTNRYATTWTDIKVGCEACHGPGSNHVAWARKEGDWQRFADRGLTIALDERLGVSWSIDPRTGNAVRSKSRESSREIETCARCHARRGQFSDRWHAGDRFADGFRASLIEPGLYYADGQMRDEVYNYASLLASRMHAAGVTCSDCHDPHSQKLRAPGSAVCGQCHAPDKFAVAAHHHHREGSPGAECPACHMPTTTYMVVDPRHDHSFSIPRPDRSVRLGVPNACTRCHDDRKPEWAADALRSWYPQPKPGFQTFADVFVDADRGAPGAARRLAGIVDDAQQSAIARASALRRLGSDLGPATLPAIGRALADADPLVRAAAAEALGAGDEETRLRWLPPLLGDPVREVRMNAARALAGPAESRLAAGDRAKFGQALAEYVEAEKFNADRPEGRTNLGNLHAARGQYDEAIAAYGSALELDPAFVIAAVNLADVYGTLGQEQRAEATLRAAIARDPQSAEVRFALGLSLVRQKRSREALEAFAEAVRLAPGNPHYAYVQAVALAESGQAGRAIDILDRALTSHPDDRELLLALAQLRYARGQREQAAAHLRHLATLAPDDPDLARILEAIRAAPLR
ncbi:tetratricopeptide repeat protein [Accumulibacter sp.]|uniref:tetratricopeptide repeat protein n=1 Tax=Accumulibacter sp. TaxID=2053492 RepID=UPI0025FF6C3F|nr:tetratricopeptide repeat protein [Accumulibacter sp.]MCM8626231.1 tetratricopeptide repeat protein [Accumulibacter sp.]